MGEGVQEFMEEEELLSGVKSQKFLIVSALITAALTFAAMIISVPQFSIPIQVYGSLPSILRLSLLVFIYDFGAPIPLAWQQAWILIPSVIGIVNAGIFYSSAKLLRNSITKSVEKSSEKGTLMSIANFQFVAAIIAVIASILSSMLTLLLVFSLSSPIFTTAGFDILFYNLNILGWALFVAEDLFGGLMMISIGVLFILWRRKLKTGDLWLATGIIYIIAGVFDFTIYLTLVGVIIAIVAGVLGRESFLTSKT